MRRYRHLSAEERDRIAEMHARHEGVSAIAAAIGRNKSTVSRDEKGGPAHPQPGLQRKGG